ncbi:RlpA-like double-psi beta-barrel-protein domain-containing protein-containing protein [Lentinula raphanica]|nr:RlpA-like double-psi beta-barrel-protein domain-containing protein-containing protein [Lentinula raphanica]
MPSTTGSAARLALLVEIVLPFLLLVLVAAPAQAIVVPVHHILRRDNGFHPGGEFHDHFRNGNPGAGSSSAEVDDASTSTAAEATTEATTDDVTATPTTSTDTTATATSTASVSGTTYTGAATYYDQGGVAGACGTVHTDQDFIVAVQSAMFSQDLCGKTVVITNDASGAQTTATVADECPGCSTSTSLDLSVAAFEALSDLSVGTFAITWVLED